MHPLGGPLAMATPLHSFPPMGPQNTRLEVEDTSPLPPMSSHLLSPPAEVHQVITFDTHTQVHQVGHFWQTNTPTNIHHSPQSHTIINLTKCTQEESTEVNPTAEPAQSPTFSDPGDQVVVDPTSTVLGLDFYLS